MKKFLASVLVIIFQIVWVDNIGSSSNFKKPDKIEYYYSETKEWICLKKAIIQVESENKDYAIGTKNDWGCLQITPIYMKECERLSGKDFNYIDRFDRNKSLEMFEIYQNHYNPEKDILKAIRLHNPKASSLYRDKILAIYKSYLNNF